MKRLSLNTNIEKPICIATCGVICFSPILSLFVKLMRSVLILPYKIDTLFIYGIFISILIISLKKIIIRSSLVTHFIILFLISGYLTSFILNSYHADFYLEFGIKFLVLSAPWLFITYAVRDYGLLKKYLYISAYVIIFSHVMNIYIFRVNVFGEAAYSQSYGYAILPAAIVLCSNILDRRSLYDIFLFTATIVFMLSMGVRGPLLCVMLFSILRIIIMYKARPKKAFAFTVVISATCVSLYLVLNKILNFLFILFQEANLSTRIISRLLEGSFFEDKSRSLLANYSIELIMRHPFVGVGIANDRILLANKMQNSVLDAIGWYPHNIFLEIFLHFGIFLGTILTIVLIYALFKSTFRNSNNEAVDIICIFIGMGFFPLIFSGSYISSPLFFALIGFVIFQLKEFRNRVGSI